MKQDFTHFLAHKPIVQAFFDAETQTISYVVADPDSRICVIIDSVMDFEPTHHIVSTENADRIVDYVTRMNYTVSLLLETHVHADHLTAAFYLRDKLGGKIAINKHITEVQEMFGEVFVEDKEFKRDGSQFDYLWNDAGDFTVGKIPAYALYTPGHTPADMIYIIGNSVFVGDTLFMPDYGTARCDFPGGSAETMFDSVQKIFSLPDEMRMFMCHDYLPEGRADYVWETTVGAQKRYNIHVHTNSTREAFVALRTKRDATLRAPHLILPSLQVNMRAGDVPRDPQTGSINLKTSSHPLFIN